MTGTSGEFDDLATMADELGLDNFELPVVRRRIISVDGTGLSAVQWGSEAPAAVLLHGGGQNAHTWDKVALLLGRPVLAIDLPGHGLSDWREDRDYWPWRNALSVATVLRQFTERPVAAVGMSLGGLTALRLAATEPSLVSSLMMVDVTPGVMARTSGMTHADRGTTRLISGSIRYDSREEMVDAVRATAPHRAEADLRRGVRHNTLQIEDGSWRWRYDQLDSSTSGRDFAELWEDLMEVGLPTSLVLGGQSKFVSDSDVEEFRARRPDATITVVPGAGHSVQSDRPRELARLIEKQL